MSSKKPNFIVFPEQLNDSLGRQQQQQVLLDGSWFMPNDPRNGRQEFQKERLPDARFFDIDEVKDKSSPYPHMLPSPSDFAKAMGDLGIKNTDNVIVYDTAGNFSAPRLLWTLKLFRHKNVSLLDNYPVYKKLGYPIESGSAPERFPSTDYEGNGIDSDKVVSYEELVSIIEDPAKLSQVDIVDARSTDRWTGSAPEPRPGLSSGHVPGSKSVPFGLVLDPETRQFLSPNEIIKVFNNQGIKGDKNIICMCGTGVTACILATALEIAGFNNNNNNVFIRLYDGSWTEYAQRAPKHLIIKSV